MDKYLDLFANLPSGFYSYLLCRTKGEKELLEFLGFQIEQTTKLSTKVEYTSKEYRCSRLDLAVLDRDQVPVEVIEAKFYYSFDGCCIHDSQLAQRSEVEKDVEKMRVLSDSISKFFVLFLVHFDSERVPVLFPYSGTNNRVMTKFRSADEMRRESSRVTLEYLQSRGLKPELKEYVVGMYDDIRVILQIFASTVE